MIDDIFAKFDGAFAKNTIRAYKSDFIQYQTWCSQKRLEPIPAVADTMAMYVDYLSINNKSATIRRRINSLGTVLKLSKNYDPTKSPEVILALKRMHRKIGRTQQQATPLTKPLLNQLLSNCDNSVRGLRNQVILRLGYETMRRRSELCDFKFADVDQTPNCKPIIRLNFSKTDCKLPRQWDSSKVDISRSSFFRYSVGGTRPVESCGRSSLYSIIHHHAIS